jgi:hypothetical protein
MAGDFFPFQLFPPPRERRVVREKRRLQFCYRIRVLLVSANKVRQRFFSMMRVVIHGVSPRQSYVFIMTCQCRNPMHVGVSSVIKKEEGSVIIRWATSQQSEPKIITISKGTCNTYCI